MEAMISRRTDGWRDERGYTHYEDVVSVWTEDGNFQMPYKLFERIFGIKLAAWIERKIVELPESKAKVLS